MCEITQKEFDELKEIAAENHRTLRGGNGDTGLITVVNLVQNDVTWIRATMEKDNKTNVTWRWLVEKFGAPILVAIVMGAIMLLGG